MKGNLLFKFVLLFVYLVRYCFWFLLEIDNVKKICILLEKKVCIKFIKCVVLINKKNNNFFQVYIILYFMNSQEYFLDDSLIIDD